MVKDAKKHFNNNNDYYKNKQLIGRGYLFRGVLVKECVMGNNNISVFHTRSKVLVKIYVHF